MQMQSFDITKRSLNLDLLKLAMALFVVGIHDSFLSEFPTLNVALAQYVFRLAVPVFFLLNGYFLARLEGDWKAFLRWFRKIAFLYIFWWIAYLPFMPTKHVTLSAAYIIGRLMIGYLHLWYLPALMGAGIIVVLAKQTLSAPISLGLAALAFLVGVCAQYSVTFHLVSDLSPDLYRNALFFGFPLVLLGANLSRVNLTSSMAALCAILLALVGALVMVAEIYARFNFGGSGSVDIVASGPFLATALLIAAMQFPLGRTTLFFSKASTFLFFSHFMVLLVFDHHTPISKIHSSVLHFVVAVAICLSLVPLATQANAYSIRRMGVGFL